MYVSRDVIFDEIVFPFSELHTNAGALFRSEINLLHPSLISFGDSYVCVPLDHDCQGADEQRLVPGAALEPSDPADVDDIGSAWRKLSRLGSRGVSALDRELTTPGLAPSGSAPQINADVETGIGHAQRSRARICCANTARGGAKIYCA